MSPPAPAPTQRALDSWRHLSAVHRDAVADLTELLEHPGPHAAAVAHVRGAIEAERDRHARLAQRMHDRLSEHSPTSTPEESP